MKIWVRKYKCVVFLAAVSCSLAVSGQERTPSCDDVQGQLNALKNSVNMAVERLDKKVSDVAGYYMRRKILLLEEEVKQLKADNKKFVPLTEKVQQLEAETQKIQTLTEDLQQLKTNDQNIIKSMDEVTRKMHRNISTITGKVEQLEAERQKIQTLTEDLQKLKTNDRKIIESMGEATGNMHGNISGITEEVHELKARDQKILDDQRDVKVKLGILWKQVKKTLRNELVASPKARLYSGSSFTGDFEDYTFETATHRGGCHDLKKLGNGVTSVDTFGKCIRLFEDYYGLCIGRSVAVYPGSGNAENVLNPNMTKVLSVGPCLAEEFEDFDLQDGTKQIIVKNSSNPRKFFPDSIQFHSKEKENKAIYLSSSSFSLQWYLLGPGNRLEFLRADVYPKHLNISQPEFEMQGLI